MIGHIDLRKAGFGVTITRAAFHRILLAETARQGVSVAYGKRLCAIEEYPARHVVAHFDDGSAAAGDMLLAATESASRCAA